MSMKSDIDKLNEKVIALTTEKTLAEKDSLAKTEEVAALELEIKDLNEVSEATINSMRQEIIQANDRIEKICDIKDDAVDEKNVMQEELDSAKMALKQPAYTDAALVGNTEVIDMIEDCNGEEAPKTDANQFKHFNKLISILNPDEKEAYRAKHNKEIEAEKAIIAKG